MKQLKRRSKLIKNIFKPDGDNIDTKISPQALTNNDVAKLNKSEVASEIETGYFDFSTGKVVFDK